MLHGLQSSDDISSDAIGLDLGGIVGGAHLEASTLHDRLRRVGSRGLHRPADARSRSASALPLPHTYSDRLAAKVSTTLLGLGGCKTGSGYRQPNGSVPD
ncbi:MAG TPA: hypothetical protein VK853_11100 [Ilumatobacteraceae bacterium]|nr:hypothetical protein [Ilumatobacteraceae bacterium]